MGRTRYVDYHPDEYISGVGGQLDGEEQGVYWMICSLMMSAGGPIAEDHPRIGHLVRMRPQKVRRIVDRLVGFYGKLQRGDDGRLSQSRVLSELSSAGKRIAKAQENGRKGGRPAAGTGDSKGLGKPNGSSRRKPTTNHQPPTAQPAENASPPPGGERHSPPPADAAPAPGSRAAPPGERGKKAGGGVTLGGLVPDLPASLGAAIGVRDDGPVVRLSAPTRLLGDLLQRHGLAIGAAFGGRPVTVAVAGLPPEPLDDTAPLDDTGRAAPAPDNDARQGERETP